MKLTNSANSWILATALVAAGAALGAPQAKADYVPQNGYRYKVVYSQWDAGFYNYYGYQEVQTCQVQYTGGWTSRTCYDQIEPTDYIYVEEQHESGGWTRVTVYSDDSYGTPFVEYDVYDDGVTRRVERRHFYDHRYITTDYTTVYYTQDVVIWTSIDWDTAWGKFFTGVVVADLGAQVLADSNGNDASTAIGVGLLASASVSSFLAAKQAAQESALEKACVAAQSSGGNSLQ